MNITIKDVLYTQIGSTYTARVGDGTTKRPNGVPKSYSGVVTIPPYVVINSVTFTVVEIGRSALLDCSNITEINLPNTITTLKQWCFGNLHLVKTIIIPASVTTVETFFIANMGPNEIYFCGTKEPTMVNTNGDDGYISADFKGVVTVPSNYDPSKTTFLKRNIQRIDVQYCSYFAYQMNRNCRTIKCRMFHIELFVFAINTLAAK
jgi:hypothetical protein